MLVKAEERKNKMPEVMMEIVANLEPKDPKEILAIVVKPLEFITLYESPRKVSSAVFGPKCHH